jgi:hypothetical protein
VFRNRQPVKAKRFKSFRAKANPALKPSSSKTTGLDKENLRLDHRFAHPAEKKHSRKIQPVFCNVKVPGNKQQLLACEQGEGGDYCLDILREITRR